MQVSKDRTLSNEKVNEFISEPSNFDTESHSFPLNNYSLPKPPKMKGKTVTKNKKSSLDAWNSIDLSEQLDQIPPQF